MRQTGIAQITTQRDVLDEVISDALRQLSLEPYPGGVWRFTPDSYEQMAKVMADMANSYGRPYEYVYTVEEVKSNLAARGYVPQSGLALPPALPSPPDENGVSLPAIPAESAAGIPPWLWLLLIFGVAIYISSDGKRRITKRTAPSEDYLLGDPGLRKQRGRRLYYMYVKPGKPWGKAVSVSSKKAKSVSPKNLYYIWAESADQARHLLKTQPQTRTRKHVRDIPMLSGAGCRDKEGRFVPVPQCTGRLQKQPGEIPESLLQCALTASKYSQYSDLVDSAVSQTFRMMYPEYPGSIDNILAQHGYGGGDLRNPRKIMRDFWQSARKMRKQKATVPLKRNLPKGLDPDVRAVYEVVSQGPIHIDKISERTGIPPYRVSAALVILELRNIVRQRVGKMFSLRESEMLSGAGCRDKEGKFIPVPQCIPPGRAVRRLDRRFYPHHERGQ